jgi:hypothetical protein
MTQLSASWLSWHKSDTVFAAHSTHCASKEVHHVHRRRQLPHSYLASKPTPAVFKYLRMQKQGFDSFLPSPLWRIPYERPMLFSGLELCCLCHSMLSFNVIRLPILEPRLEALSQITSWMHVERRRVSPMWVAQVSPSYCKSWVSSGKIYIKGETKMIFGEPSNHLLQLVQKAILHQGTQLMLLRCRWESVVLVISCHHDIGTYCDKDDASFDFLPGTSLWSRLCYMCS